MKEKDLRNDGSSDETCCQQCVGCLQCCNLPASTGVKIVSIISILLGLVLACLGVWMTIVTTKNNDLPQKSQVYFRKPVDESEGDRMPRKLIPLNRFYNYLLTLGIVCLAVGIVRTISSIFLLWNSVEKHSRTPGKMWIILSILETTSLVTFLLVTLNMTGLMDDVPWAPVRMTNDMHSFYLLLTITRIVSFCDIFLTIYFVLIVFWFVATR